ncbi:hypothetical protein PUV54_14840 [Hyphococcus flavus]|uniref:PilZ domain-containing protein n=1 Tax=Hyphococcus flavus TaxID=1866326 RepID=A0AAF0CBK9_9PROT|nr:hypothetical protein [Hyphococcus flavus]WDI31225.1 hypothetical protein PUV54_14840 [Hyphococcus flavus]
MNAPLDTHRRRARRHDAALIVRFSINGGAEQTSETLNFTSKSLAVRSACSARKGDFVSVRFGLLPSISGEVVRVFPEGFAVILSEESLELLAQTANDPAMDAAADFTEASSENNVLSPYIRANSTIEARIRLSTAPEQNKMSRRHYLTLITADATPLANVGSIWLKSNQTRWSSRALQFKRHGDRGYALIGMNDWQLHMAAAYGLTIGIINSAMEDWSFAIDAEPFADHLYALEPNEFAISA